MGNYCGSSSDNTSEVSQSPINRQIFEGERRLGLGFNNISEVQTVFQQFEADGNIPIQHIADILGRLKVKKIKDCSESIINKLRRPDNQVELLPLYTASILLCRAKPSDKALIIWRIFDMDKSGTLSKKECLKLFQVLAQAALDVFVEPAAGVVQVDVQRAQDYVGDLKLKQDSFALHMTEIFLKGELSLAREEFIRVITNEPEAGIMNTISIRDRVEAVSITRANRSM